MRRRDGDYLIMTLGFVLFVIGFLTFFFPEISWVSKETEIPGVSSVTKHSIKVPRGFALALAAAGLSFIYHCQKIRRRGGYRCVL